MVSQPTYAGHLHREPPRLPVESGGERLGLGLEAGGVYGFASFVMWPGKRGVAFENPPLVVLYLAPVRFWGLRKWPAYPPLLRLLRTTPISHRIHFPTTESYIF